MGQRAAGPIERYRSWMSHIRDVGRWLQAGHADAYVLSDRWKAQVVPAHPYLLSRREIERSSLPRQGWTRTARGGGKGRVLHADALLRAADRNPAAATRTRAPARPEPRRRVRQSSRSRRLPLTSEVTEVLAGCDRISAARFGPSRRVLRLHDRQPGHRRDRREDVPPYLGPGRSPDRRGGQQPRPYDFRHHFAYATSNGGRGRAATSPRCCPTWPDTWGTRASNRATTSTPRRSSCTPTPTSRPRASHAAAGRVRMKRDPTTGASNFYTFTRDYLHTYLPTVARRSPKTIEAYRISLECFLHYLADHDRRARPRQLRPLRAATPQGLAGLDEPAGTTRRHRAAAEHHQAFLTYCSGEDITLVALSQAARPVPTGPARWPIRYLTESETRAVLAAFTGRTEIPQEPDAADPALRHRRPCR